MGGHDTVHPSAQRLSKLPVYIKRPVNIHEKKKHVYQKPEVSNKKMLCFTNIY
jgi:hypothetical protein